jgi:hypothetical protein
MYSYLLKTKLSFFFFLQKQRTGRQNMYDLGVGTSGRGGDITKGCSKRANLVEILYIRI